MIAPENLEAEERIGIAPVLVANAPYCWYTARMKIMVVSDLHYSLKQFDWLVANAARCDLMIIAGDLMELGSYVEPDIQAVVVERYFRSICETVPLVVCSGNHDLVEEGDGQRTPEWLSDISIPGLVVDCQYYEDERIRILAIPWWETRNEREKVEDWLESQQSAEDDRPVVWVNHAPPRGTKTGWDGKRDLGDETVARWIEKHSPALVVSGHVHNAPYYEGGSWIDHMGDTVITNGGRQTGAVPATIVWELDSGKLTWCGMEGCEERKLELV